MVRLPENPLEKYSPVTRGCQLPPLTDWLATSGTAFVAPLAIIGVVLEKPPGLMGTHMEMSYSPATAKSGA